MANSNFVFYFTAPGMEAPSDAFNEFWRRIATEAAEDHASDLVSVEPTVLTGGEPGARIEIAVFYRTPEEALDIAREIVEFARAELRTGVSVRSIHSEEHGNVPLRGGSVDAAAALDFWIDPGDAPPELIADVLAALSELHRAYGGNGLVYHTDGEQIAFAEVEQ